jgi:redox-sensitive bicupin YhaK (pirin superfamily)
MGEKRTFGANTVQTMSAGTGVVHSEFNASESQPVRFLQIWIEPAVQDVEPSYQQIPFDPAEKRGKLRLLAAPKAGVNGQPAAVIHQDAFVYAAVLGSGETLKRNIAPGRYAWVQIARGDLSVNGQALAEGDGAAISAESDLSFTGAGPEGSEFLFFDLA